MELESAPVPATGNAGGNLCVLAERRGKRGLQTIVLRVVGAIRVSLPILPGVDRLLDHIQAATAGFLPPQIGAPAEIAGTGRYPLGVESSLLIEGNEVGCVGRAKKVATMAAVMPTQEEAERGAAGR